MEERIQKILAKCGIASRRKAEEMILEGMVTVNGASAVLGMKADLERDHIKVRGKLIHTAEQKVYLMFYKPDKCLTTMSDSEGRATVKDFLKGVKAHVFPVGRLDYNSEGLLILTNDGDMAQSILHPAQKVPKTYLVKVDGFLEDKAKARLEKGIRLEDGLTAPAKVKKIKETEANSWIEITIYEGKKRQVRRMLESVGHPVIKLKRTRINGLSLGRLEPGTYRHLTPEEIKRLNKDVGAAPRGCPPKGQGQPGQGQPRGGAPTKCRVTPGTKCRITPGTKSGNKPGAKSRTAPGAKRRVRPRMKSGDK